MPGQVLPSHRAAHHDLRFAARALWQQQSWALLPVRRPPHSWLTAPASPPRHVTIIHHNRCLTACDSVMLGPLIAMLWMCDGHRGLTVCRQAPGSLFRASAGLVGTRNRSLSRTLFGVRSSPCLLTVSAFAPSLRSTDENSERSREFSILPRFAASSKDTPQRRSTVFTVSCIRFAWCRRVEGEGGTRWDGLGSDRDPMGLCHIPMHHWQTRSQENMPCRLVRGPIIDSSSASPVDGQRAMPACARIKHGGSLRR